MAKKGTIIWAGEYDAEKQAFCHTCTHLLVAAGELPQIDSSIASAGNEVLTLTGHGHDRFNVPLTIKTWQELLLLNVLHGSQHDIGLSGQGQKGHVAGTSCRHDAKGTTGPIRRIGTVEFAYIWLGNAFTRISMKQFPIEFWVTTMCDIPETHTPIHGQGCQ
jgi:hypothetical protein